jgi:2-methylcitrate dehydratase PrpD
MVEARDRSLPPDVMTATRHRMLDTLGADRVWGALEARRAAIRYVRAQGGTAEAIRLHHRHQDDGGECGAGARMFAHADETDDFEPVTKAHPGCSVVPAALAIGDATIGRASSCFAPSRLATTSAVAS